MANWTTTGYQLFNATALPATAEFTIVPNSGYSISASQFDYNETIDYIVDITFSDNGNAGTPANTVKGTIQFVGSDDYTFNADIQQSITLSVVEQEQINAITLSTAVTAQSYGNNAFTTGAQVSISTNSLYTGYEATINDSFNWNVETANNGTTYVAFPSVSVPLDSHVNFMEILITPDPGHYFVDSPSEDADGDEVFALEDSSLTLHLPGVGNGTQSYQAEEYLNEQSWEIARELIMEPVNGTTQSTSEDVMVCTGIKFTINYFSPPTVLLLDLNNNNTYDEELIINVSIPGIVPRVLYFLDQGPLHVGYGQLSNFQLPIKNTVNSYSFTESGTDTDIFDPDPQAFANFVSLNIAQNSTQSEKSATLTITANPAAVTNSPGVTSSSIQIVQNPGPFIFAYGKLSSQDENSYSIGVETVSSFGETITLKVETNIPENNDFTAAEALLNVFILTGDGIYPTVNNGQEISDTLPFSDAEVEVITTEIQNGFDIPQQSNNVATVEISIPENTGTTLKVISIVFNHPLDSSLTTSVTILQEAGYSSSINTLQFFAATGYDENGIPTGFESINDAVPSAKTDNNYIQNDGGVITIYAKYPSQDLSNTSQSLQDMFVLQNLSEVNPPGVNGENNYFLSSNEEGYQHFNNLQITPMTGVDDVNVKLTFDAPQNDYYFSNNSSSFTYLSAGTLSANSLLPQKTSLIIKGYNPLNPYFNPNNSNNNPPDDSATLFQAQLDTVVVSSFGSDPSGASTQITNNLDVDYFDSETGQVKVEILQYKDIQVDEETGDLSLTDWKTTAIDGPPAWCGFDENFTTSSLTSPESLSAFDLTNFSVTLYHQASSSTIGRSVRLGYSTLSAPVDSSDITTFNQPFARLKQLNFTTPDDYIILNSVNFSGNSNDDINYEFDQSLIYNSSSNWQGNYNDDFVIGHGGPNSQYSDTGGEHVGFWWCNLPNAFKAVNDMQGGLSSDRTFVFRYKLNPAFGDSFKIRRYTVIDNATVITQVEDPGNAVFNPDADLNNFIHFIFANTAVIDGETYGQLQIRIDASAFYSARENGNFFDKIAILVSREDFNDDVFFPSTEYPHNTEMLIIDFDEIPIGSEHTSNFF